jgi:hypothetical protein
MTEKMFDCVIIASDSKDNNKVRFCNNLAMRVKVLQRDNFTIHDAIQLERKMTKREIIDFLLERQHERKCDEDREAVDNALDILKRKNQRITSFDDVRNAILSRKLVTQTTDQLVE